MPSFFSSTDDKYELGDPGIHLVVGSIDVEKMKYTISASVVGGGRRFLMPYSNLIDATPVESITFHPDVLKYVDYSSPASIFTPVKVHNKNNSKKSEQDSSDYTQWLEKHMKYDSTYSEYRDYMDDPFYYSDKRVEDGSSKLIKLWEIEDLIRDYIHQNSDDYNKIHHLYDMLKANAKEVDELIFT